MSDPIPNIKILGERFQDRTLDVGRSKFVDFVSHGTQLDACRIIIHGSARSIVFHGATLTDCQIVAKRKFTGFHWHDVQLLRCRFFGTYENCRFGPRPSVYPDGPHGSFEQCDLSQAKLGWCEFYHPEPEAMLLPGWPTFTILHPLENADAWSAIPFPDAYAAVKQRMICGRIPDLDLAGLGAVTQNAQAVAKECNISLDDVRDLISGQSFIRY